MEGVGVCAISLGKAFDESGLLGSVLCPLLERLGSSYYNVSHAADIVLQTISSRCGYSSVSLPQGLSVQLLATCDAQNLPSLRNDVKTIVCFL